MDLYIYEDFLDENLLDIATKYKNSELDNVEVHLVNFVMYNETTNILGDSEAKIKENIHNVIKNKYKNFSNDKININENNILKRITYIIMPIWELDKLLEIFSGKIRG